MNSAFSEQILGNKLSKLNSSQQCIETLSHWCIFHQSKAELVVTIWDRQFHVSEIEQKVPLLYLANDILQNSKRKGNEFVTEFWKVLPKALKDIAEQGNERGKNVVSRLVEIWEERRVFGSRAKGLKELMLEEEAPPPLEFKRKRSRSVRIVKRNSHSIRTKLTIGGAAEKIVSAFHLVSSEDAGDEDNEMSKCRSAIQRVRKMEEEVDLACIKGKDPKRKTLSKELEEQENVLEHSIEKFKVVEANRIVLVSQLREALNEQESELENIRTQIQVAQAQAEEASNMRKRLDDENYITDQRQSTGAPPTPDVNTKATKTPKKTAAAVAADLADKLTASTSSQFIMSSVLSSFAAEEAKNAGLTKSSSASRFPSVPTTLASNMPPQQLVAPPTTTYQSVLVPQSSFQSQTPTPQIQYHILPSPLSQHYIGSYTYGGVTSLQSGPVPPPPPPHYVSNMMPINQQQMQMTQQLSTQMHSMITPQQPLMPPSFRPAGLGQPSGMVYYGQPNHSQ